MGLKWPPGGGEDGAKVQCGLATRGERDVMTDPNKHHDGRAGDRRGPRPQNDNFVPHSGTPERLLDDLIMSLRFFSRLPSGRRAHLMPELSRIGRVLPVASLVIGLGPVLVLALARAVGLPPLFAAALGVGAAILVCGAMAEDGLADAADGLFGGASVARRLEIMKDSRHGTYGVAALALLLILRVSALAGLVLVNPMIGAALWLAAMITARSGALWLSVVLAPARADGVSASAGRVTAATAGLGTMLAIILGVILAAPFTGLMGIGVALVVETGIVYGWILLCRRLVGGQTGDLIGALTALLEVGALGVFLIFT